MLISMAAAVGMTATALGMVLTPGPNMMYLVSRSISQGRIAGLISLAGTGIGFVVYMTMANVGLGVVFVAVPWLFIGFKAAGAAYLGYLAWQALKPGGRGLFETHELERDSSVKLLPDGLGHQLVESESGDHVSGADPAVHRPASWSHHDPGVLARRDADRGEPDGERVDCRGSRCDRGVHQASADLGGVAAPNHRDLTGHSCSAAGA